MSRSCVASPSLGLQWASLLPFSYVQPPGSTLAMALIGGWSLTGLTSISPYTTPHLWSASTAITRVSPMGFLVIEVGRSYFRWLSDISNSYIDFDASIKNNNTLPQLPTNLSVPQSPIFIYSKDLIISPSKDLATVSSISKGLVLVDLSPVCKWGGGGELVDNGEHSQRRRSARIASRTARTSTTSTSSAPDAGSSRERGLLVTNGGRRNGFNGGDPGGNAGSNSGSSSGRRGRKRAGREAPAPPGPPSPPSGGTHEEYPDDDSDDDSRGWIFLFFSGILLLFVILGSRLKHQQSLSRRWDEFDTDLVAVGTFKGHPFMHITRFDVFSFFLFFILCGAGSDRRRSNMAHFLNYHEIKTVPFPEAVPISPQTMDESNSSSGFDDTITPGSNYTITPDFDDTVTPDLDDLINNITVSIEDDAQTDTLASEPAFFTDTELSDTDYEGDESEMTEDFDLTAVCGPSVENDLQEVPVGVAEVSVVVDTRDNSVFGGKDKGKGKADIGVFESVRSPASSPVGKRGPSPVENTAASSSKVPSTFSRLYVPVYKHRRSHPRTLTVFVQADAPERGFIHFDLPNYSIHNNRFITVDFSRRKTPFFLRKMVTDVVEQEGDADT